MKGFPGNRLKRIIVACVVLMLLFSASVFAMGIWEEGESETRTITGQFNSFDRIYTWDYLYSDGYFRRSSEEYNHNLARLSLGMALASFRDLNNPDNQGGLLVDYFEKLGLEDIETDSYNSEPQPYSVTYGMGTLKLWDTNVVVVAICSGNYGAEWASNLTVGDNTRSDGFQDASQKVQKALKEYMERHTIRGDVKLWITGYSRGGAVANITAADCIDSGVFDDVYAYTFATPLTTREPGNYNNIFNIIQKNDVVPKVPLADWGYRHYGNDLFLVSPEVDIDCKPVVDRAKEIYREMVGHEMVMNFELNYQLRVLCDYLLLLLPDSATYTEYLQPLVLDIMTSSDGTGDALLILLEALRQYSDNDKQHGEELKAMRDYLGTMIGIYYLQDGVSKLPEDQWTQEFGTLNLFNDHFPFEYLSLMYASDDPVQIFSSNTRYERIVIYGKVDARIYDGDRLMKTVLSNGTEFVDGVKAPGSLPYVECSDEKLVITLPADRSFRIEIQSKSRLPQTVSYTGLLFSGDTVKATGDDLYSYLMKFGETAVIRTSSSGKVIEAQSSDHTDVSEYVGAIYSPTTAMRLENNEVVHLTISGLVNKILFILVLLVVQMIVSIVLTIIRKKKQRKRNAVVALVWHGVIAAVFAILELAMWYFVPVLTIAKFIPAALVYIVFVVYALKGYLAEKKSLKAFFILLGVMTAYLILESLIIGDYALWKAIIKLIIYATFMIAAYQYLWFDEKKGEPVSVVGLDFKKP